MTLYAVVWRCIPTFAVEEARFPSLTWENEPLFAYIFLFGLGDLQLCLREHRLDIFQLHVLPGQVDPGHPAQVVAGIGPVVEAPPVALEVRAAHGRELVGDHPGGVLPVRGGLDGPQDAERDVAGEEVRLDVLLS